MFLILESCTSFFSRIKLFLNINAYILMLLEFLISMFQITIIEVQNVNLFWIPFVMFYVRNLNLDSLVTPASQKQWVS
jgi:hypothetical protein